MKRNILHARGLLLLACIAVAPMMLAADPRGSLVVSAQWLSAHLKDPNLVLLHVGDKKEYEEGHIPGARLTSLGELHFSDHENHGVILEMPDPEDLRKRLEAVGISDDSRVIVYYGKDWISPATRIMFTLDYAGLGARASLLDGGKPAWVRGGGTLTAEPPAKRTGKLSPLKIQPTVVDAQFVRAHLGKPGFALVDGRAAVFYDGVETGQSHDAPHRTGHITGAGNFPFTTLVDDQLRLRSPEEWRALLAKAGVKPGDTVIGYCHIGMQTTAPLFAARSLGHKVLLYDGSFDDWSKRQGYPVTNPSEKTK